MDFPLDSGKKEIPGDVDDYFVCRISMLDPAVRRVLVFDTDKFGKGFLKDDKIYMDRRGKRWEIFLYNGENDFSFRCKWLKSDNPNRIVWVTFPKYSRKDSIDISYIPDVIDSAEDIIDLSVGSVLSDVIRDLPSMKFGTEKWGNLFAPYKDVIAKNLRKFVSSFTEFRKAVPEKPLNKNHLRAILLRMDFDFVGMEDFVLDGIIDEKEVFLRLIKLKSILRERVKDERLKEWVLGYSSSDVLIKILDSFLEDIIKTIYIYLVLTVLGISGVKSFLVSRYGESSNVLIEKGFLDYVSGHFFTEIISYCESILKPEESRWVVDIILDQLRGKSIFDMVGKTGDIYPLISVKLLIHFIRNISEPLADADLIGVDNLPAGENSKYGIITHFLKTVRWIQSKIESPVPDFLDYEKILDWYYGQEIFKIQLLLDRAGRGLESSIGADLYREIRDKVEEFRSMVRECIDVYNRRLADKIGTDYYGFKRSRSSSVRVFKKEPEGGLFDINSRSLSRKENIWVLVFDGMRLDTWEMVIKPRLTEFFQIDKEKIFYSILPSFTDFCRRSIFAGEFPENWQCNFDGQRTKDEGVLFARNIGVSTSREYDQFIRFITNADTDDGQEELKFKNSKKKRFNILVFNLSDNWIHEKDASRQSITTINDRIFDIFNNKVEPLLRNEVQQGDTVFITSDHGFIELEEKDTKLILVPTSTSGGSAKGNPVNYRYIENLQGYEKEGLKMTVWKGLDFVLAVGFEWFLRQGGRYAKYNHGGVSFDEMVIPGARLTRIVSRIFAFSLEDVPDSMSLEEDKQTDVRFIIKNKGNMPGDVSVSIKKNGNEVFVKTYHLPIGKEVEIKDFTFKPSMEDKVIEIIVKNVDNPDQKEKRIIPLQVKPTKAFFMSIPDELDELEDL